MPRKAKAPGGGQPNGLPPSAPTGMPYGDHQATIQAQQAMPLPAAPPVGGLPADATPPGGPPPGGPPVGPPAAPGVSMADALAAAASAAPPQGGLGDPSQRPGEHPLTGASPLPVQQSSTYQVAKMIADLTGDPVAQALAQRATEMGQ